MISTTMAFNELSTADKDVVFQCMKAIAEGNKIDDGEFQTRLGISRRTLRRIIAAWPKIDDGSEDSDEFLAINSCLNEVCHGVDIAPAEWGKWFRQPKDEIKQTLGRWLRLRGETRGGIR